MMTVQGKSLPGQVSAYRGRIDGLEGFVVSVGGRSCFITLAAAKQFGTYLQEDEPRPDSGVVTLHGLLQESDQRGENTR